MSEKDLISQLKAVIEERVIITKESGAHIVATNNPSRLNGWIFDFRSVLLDATFLNLIAELFWQTYEKKYPFQVGGLETASIALVTAIIIKGAERGTPTNGFYIRKSRKPEGLQKIIEGNLTADPVILVDDLINSGGSFIKQIVILEKENKKVSDIFTLIRFREIEKYIFAKEKDIKISSVLTLEEFGLSLETQSALPKYDLFTINWTQRLAKPEYFYRVPKSAPIIDGAKVYFGSDDGVMRALSQETGKEIWKYKILGLGIQGKTIFSSPALFENTLYFGAYDGNFYALDAETGKKKWIYMDADWIGSSPCVAEDLKLVYVGLEYGLWKKRGGIVALDAGTGKKKWEYIEMPEYTHCSPAYSKKHGVVAIGSNDSCVYLFRANDGKLLWKVRTTTEVKGSLSFDEKRGYVVFGSMDGTISIVRIQDGSLVFTYKANAGIYSTPLITNGRVYVSSLDKKIYCINLNTFDVEWVFESTGRVFASPAIFNNMIYVGSNDGRLYELNAESGKNESFFQTTERITNKIAYNKETGRFFVPTYANEIYCIEKKK